MRTDTFTINFCCCGQQYLFFFPLASFLSFQHMSFLFIFAQTRVQAKRAQTADHITELRRSSSQPSTREKMCAQQPLVAKHKNAQMFEKVSNGPDRTANIACIYNGSFRQRRPLGLWWRRKVCVHSL